MLAAAEEHEMSLSSPHPDYTMMLPDWDLMRHTYAGQRTVKEHSFRYLPPTVGMAEDDLKDARSPGYQAYMAYKARAVFYEFVKDGVEAMIGLLHRKPPAITLPAGMEDMRDNASAQGESLEQLLRRVNEQQLALGRVGLFADLPEGVTLSPTVRPWISVYTAENIRNWDEKDTENEPNKLELTVLDESKNVRTDDLSWKWVTRYRMLRLNAETGVYEQALAQSDDAENGSMSIPPDSEFIQPAVRGNTLDRIPFVFINSKDLLTKPDAPPLLSLGQLSIAIYQQDADYRQSLHMQGQDTLVIIGSTPPDPNVQRHWRTGAGATIELPAGPGADVKYVGVSSEGLAEQRTSLENDKLMAANRAGQLIDLRSGQRESGAALSTRVAAQTATLTQIALTGAAGLQQILRVIAQWRGLDPEEVVVEPNLDFGDLGLTGDDLVKMITARSLGFPLSKRSLHGLAQEKGLTTLDYEEEQEEIRRENEEDLDRAPGTGAGGNPALGGGGDE